MKNSVRKSEATPQLSESCTARINAYALAAGAAGVSLMALAQPASAEIVYTPANGTLHANQAVPIDINHDGTPDFDAFLYTFAYHTFNASLNLTPRLGGGVVGAGPGDLYVAALFKGNNIGQSRSFVPHRANLERSRGTALYSTFYHRSVKGLWSNVTNRYVGVRFSIDGATHYGWIRMTVSDTRRPITATITGYAYETVADQPIKAGQLNDEASNLLPLGPIAAPSLGTLALGSPGLELWRRENTEVAAFVQ